VVESRKLEARAAVTEFLRSTEARTAAKSIIVRVNALGSEYFTADVQAITASTLTLVNLPKVEAAQQIDAAVAVIDRAFTNAALRPTLRVLANIESPKGLRNASEIAAHPRVAGLQLGYADLFGPYGIERRDSQHTHSVMFAVRMAAAEAGVFAYDGAFADVKDTDGFRQEAQTARRLGFLGKSCIHPNQVALANEVFRPGAAELEQARRLLDAARNAQANGAGAFLLDGRMIDTPDIRRAELIVASGARD
jgi:citrate lyase beta subunit